MLGSNPHAHAYGGVVELGIHASFRNWWALSHAGSIPVTPTKRRLKMTVGELISELQKMNPKRVVVVSSDSEGNSFNELICVEENSRYDAKHRNVGIESLTDTLISEGYTEEDLMQDGVPAVVLFP